MGTPIVVVAYNRVKPMKRLLNSLENAIYSSNDVPLIISIDKGDNSDVIKAANDFQWSHGEKKVFQRKENMGLRKHILSCGDLSLEYGSVIILEDDLFVSPYFYEYAVQALKFVDADERVSGVSLYSHKYNQGAFEPFEPVMDGYDNWYLQFAASWGEAWTKQQWENFKEWYSKNKDKTLISDCMPTHVSAWGSQSWLKYYIKYTIDTDKYFFYPRWSLTTNFSESGTHAVTHDTTYQVPLQNEHINYRFSTLDETKAIYDGYFENQKLSTYKGMNVTVDLYGKKQTVSSKYYLTRKAVPYKIIEQYGCELRPHDMNILYGIQGQDFFLYDTEIKDVAPLKPSAKDKMIYCIKNIDTKRYHILFLMYLDRIKRAFMRRTKKRR